MPHGAAQLYVYVLCLRSQTDEQYSATLLHNAKGKKSQNCLISGSDCGELAFSKGAASFIFVRCSLSAFYRLWFCPVWHQSVFNSFHLKALCFNFGFQDFIRLRVVLMDKSEGHNFFGNHF